MVLINNSFGVWLACQVVGVFVFVSEEPECVYLRCPVHGLLSCRPVSESEFLIELFMSDTPGFCLVVVHTSRFVKYPACVVSLIG